MAAFLQQALHQVQKVSAIQHSTPVLPPFPHSLGVLPAYYANANETIELREHIFSLTGDSFTITTIDGRPILQVQGEVLSLSGRKHVTDPSGQPLFDLRKEHFALHATFSAEGPNNSGRLFQVKNKFKRTYPQCFRPTSTAIGLYSMAHR
jgi:LURP-one-related